MKLASNFDAFNLVLKRCFQIWKFMHADILLASWLQMQIPPRLFLNTCRLHLIKIEMQAFVLMLSNLLFYTCFQFEDSCRPSFVSRSNVGFLAFSWLQILKKVNAGFWITEMQIFEEMNRLLCIRFCMFSNWRWFQFCMRGDFWFFFLKKWTFVLWNEDCFEVNIFSWEYFL